MLLKTLHDRGLALAEAIPYGLIALVARVAAGGVFWRSGQTKLDGFGIADSTFYLFREEYHVPILPPDVAAVLSTVGENVLSVLLIVGLASRLSAAGLLIMTAVIQVFVFPEGWPDHILWASSLLLVLGRGPGPIAIDRLVRRALQRGGVAQDRVAG
ncbi:MAG: DoxX family protein [Amaricoccus sp.]